MAGFREKLAQLPPGLHFKTVMSKAELEAHSSDLAEAEEAASANGDVIEVTTPR